MNSKTGGNRGPRRAAALTVATALAGAAAVAALATACGATPAPSTANPPTYAQVLALVQCMRGHGEPNFHDPGTSGSYSLTSNGSIEGAGGASVDINSSQAQAAYGDCRHLLPGGPSIAQLEQDEQQEQQQQAQALPALLKYSQCMRGHGVPNFPSPGQSGAPAPGTSIDVNSPQYLAAASACQKVLPAGAHVSTSQHQSSSVS
jgi:hypothetical protein